MADTTVQYSPNHHRADDMRYIPNYQMWNMWPVCPVKRYPRSGRMETAYLYADQETADAFKEGKVRLRLGNIYNSKPTDPVKEYPTLAAFFDDGWMVD